MFEGTCVVCAAPMNYEDFERQDAVALVGHGQIVMAHASHFLRKDPPGLTADCQENQRKLVVAFVGLTGKLPLEIDMASYIVDDTDRIHKDDQAAYDDMLNRSPFCAFPRRNHHIPKGANNGHSHRQPRKNHGRRRR